MSRDQADIAALYKQLSFAGVRIVTSRKARSTNLKGTMNQLFLKDFANKTRRGLRGRVEAGKSRGGASFGYDVVRRTLLWGRVEARQGLAALPRGANRGKALNRANRPRHLFSGMVTFGLCGGACR